MIAIWLSHVAATLPAWGAVALILVAAMAVTPFLNDAATVPVMAPMAATFTGDLGYRPEAFLMATVVGAGCDFLTPIGHQCDTLVLGPGGLSLRRLCPAGGAAVGAGAAGRHATDPGRVAAALMTRRRT